MGKNKAMQAAIIGVIMWLLGFAAVMLLFNLPAFPAIAVVGVLVGAPLPVWFVSWRFLAGTRKESLSFTALTFSAIVLMIQFLLDGLFAASVLFFNMPRFDSAAIKGLFLALEIGYFYISVIPWATSKRLASVGDQGERKEQFSA
jgi:hypothetical protein